MKGGVDYKAIQALKAVVELQSFELAANKLYITQSAVSQRIKSLEASFGAPVLIRVLPYEVTNLGQSLLSHLAKVEWLEMGLLKENRFEQDSNLHLSIAINQDSLDTWFIDVLEMIGDDDFIRLDIKAFDQDLTYGLLQKGEVISCISTREKTYKGCNIEKLGEIDYFLVCTPDFYDQYFNRFKNDNDMWLDMLKKAPSLLFNQYDQLNAKFMEKFYGFQANLDNCHIVPSVRGFKQMCLQGKGYALLPKSDILNEISTGQLIILDKKCVWKMPLYWHYWDLPDDTYRKVVTKLISLSKQKLFEVKNYSF